ncbi:RNA polymerase-associated protein CTR9 homolog [Drosophila navojoa]|uniref:RNA polymerase-associated protein CTR9 homolog n=1 Tax=Drosophila navojoa TaxID=7232 RepID=UPI000847C65F|nr:RNA polymerase-associated protein CTR9 homolog [Drosophila navojoa]
MQNRNLTKIDFYQSPMQRNDSDNSYMGDADKALESLTSKRAKLRDWIQRAWTYYNKNQIAGFVMLLENSITRGVGGYPGYKEDLLKTHMMLTGHYFRMACNDVGQRSCNWQEKVVSQLEIMDAMNMVCNEIQYLLCRGFALMLVEDCLPEADKHFVCVLRQSPYNVPALLGRGCLAYNRQEYITALGYFKTVLSHHPDGPADVRLGIAHCFLKMGALDRAGRAFELAAESNSLCINALIGAAQLKLNERKRESNIAAMELLRSALKLNDRHPVVLTWLSFHLYYTRNYENLRTAAGNAFVITDDPDLKAQNCYNIARSFHATKDYDRAFDFYGKAVKCQPNFPPAHLGVAQIYVRRGQLDLAELSLRTLLKMMPENKEALCMLGLIYTQSNESNKLNRAVLLFQRALDHGGREDCNTWLALGNVYERKQQWQQAIDAYEKAISVYQSAQSKDKDIPLPWLNNLAALQQHAGLPEAALATLDKAIRELPKNPNSEHSESNLLTLRFNRARVLEDLGRMNEAASSYMCLTVEYPNYFDSYLRLGVMAIKGNQAVVAKEHFKTITLLEVDHILARTFMGNLCARHNALSEAMCSYNVIMRRPNHAWDSNTLVAVANVCLLKAKEATKNGESDMVRKHQERALQLFAKGLQENKRNLWAANGIGVVLCHFGYLSDAETIFKMIVKSTPRCTNAILNAAHVAMGLEHYSDAVEIYGKYLKDFLPANNVTELQFLAHALYQCQQFDEAKLMLSRAMRTAPHDPNIIYNMGLVIKQAIKSSFESIQTDLTKLQEAAQEVNIALRFFQYLSQGMEPMKSARKQSKKCSKLQRKVLEELENLREQEELSKKQERRKAKKNKKRKPEKESPNEESRKINEETQTQVDEPVESPTVDNKNSKKKRSKKRRNSTRDVDEQQDLELEKSKRRRETKRPQ